MTDLIQEMRARIAELERQLAWLTQKATAELYKENPTWVIDLPDQKPTGENERTKHENIPNLFR